MNYNFRLPGIPETPASLAQPKVVRSVPFALVVNAGIVTVTAIIQTVAALWPASNEQPPGSVPLALIGPVCFLGMALFVASRVRLGDRLYLWLARISVVFVSVFAASHGNAPAGVALSLGVSAWLLYALFAYEGPLVTGGASFRDAPSYNPAKERIVRIAGLVVIAFYCGVLFVIARTLMRGINLG
jgi:hypothetical protein